MIICVKVEQSIIFSSNNENQGLYHRDYTNRPYLVNEGKERLKGSNLFLQKKKSGHGKTPVLSKKKVSNYRIMSNNFSEASLMADLLSLHCKETRPYAA